jgi:protein-tyrosine phosphatase
MIDTHSHLLPGVDHGCPDLETSILMARAAADSGVDVVVCTPHLPEWDEALIRRTGIVLREVKEGLAAAGVELELLSGFEVDLSVALTVDITRLCALTIEGSGGAILFEMPYSGWPLFIEEVIFRLSAEGLTPVLAHPERNERVQKSSDLLAGCLKAGAVAQATAGSIGGMFGKSAERTFFRLISEGLISLLASDAHSFREEGWTMGPMLETLRGRVSAEDLLTLTETNPRRLLTGTKLLPVRPEDGKGRRRRRILP